jgi:uncharacterized protein (TIGR04255 family)
MAEIRHLRNAPITEAIVDFRASLPADFKAEAFAQARDQLRESYPVVEEQRVFRAKFAFKEGKPAHPDTESIGLQGYFFKSHDGRNIAQFRVDGFTYNRLAPYTSWGQILPEALRLWELYVTMAKPEGLSRLALRYINHIKVPAKGDLSKYLLVLPTYFPGAPRYLASFLVRTSSHDPETGYLANVTETLERSPDAADAVVILDIDVYTVRGLELGSDPLRVILQELRTIKNNIFFGSITEELAKTYE